MRVTKDKLAKYFATKKHLIYLLLNWKTTFENVLEAENADLRWATEDDDEFAERLGHVPDHLRLSGARRSDQRTAW